MKTKWKVNFTFTGDATVYAESRDAAEKLIKACMTVEVAEKFWDDEADYSVDGPEVTLVDPIIEKWEAVDDVDHTELPDDER